MDPNFYIFCPQDCIWLLFFLFRQPGLNQRYFSDEPVDAVKRDDFIKRYYEEMAAKEAQTELKPVTGDDQNQGWVSSIVCRVFPQI